MDTNQNSQKIQIPQQTPVLQQPVSNFCTTFCPNYLRLVQIQKQLIHYKSLCKQFQQSANQLRLVSNQEIKIGSIQNLGVANIISRNTIQNMNGCSKCSVKTKKNEKLPQTKRQYKKQLIQFSQRLAPRIKYMKKKQGEAMNKEIVKQQKQQINQKSQFVNVFLDQIMNYKQQTFREKKQGDIKNDQENNVQTQIKQFSNKIEQNQYKQPQKIKITKTIKDIPKANKFISDFCLFGISKASLQKTVKQKLTEAQPELIYSLNNMYQNQHYNHTAKYLCGNTIQIKRIRKQKIFTDANLIIFQSLKKQSNYIYAFKSDDINIDQTDEQQKQFLNMINPNRKLFTITLKFYDYTMLYQQSALVDFNMSVKQFQGTNAQMIPDQQSLSQRRRRQELQNKRKQLQGYSTRRYLTIFTFYPFFQFFENLLISLLNIIKLEKLDIYRKQLMEEIKQVDSDYLFRRIKETYQQSIQKFNQQIIKYGNQYIFNLKDNIMEINTQNTPGIQKYWVVGWVQSILKIFNKDTFYDTLCSIILEQQIVFVCENIHNLTYIIYMFSELLLRPFSYPHPTVYIVSQQQFLYAPTTIILGLNKNPQWLLQNKIIQKYDKTYIIVNETSGVKIVRRKQQKRIRSKKLKQMSNTFYKNFQKGILTFFKKKKQEQQMNSQANIVKDSILFIKNVNSFFKQQIIDDIPKQQILNLIKDRILGQSKSQNQDFATQISDQITRQMLKKKKQDPLIQKFLKTQIFSSYLFAKLKLQ